MGALTALSLCSDVALSSQGWARPTPVFAQLCLWDSAGSMYRRTESKEVAHTCKGCFAVLREAMKGLDP